MKEPAWVLPEVVTGIHPMLLAEHGGIHGVRDKTLLESALNRSRQRFECADDPPIFDLAASYCHGLVSNPPFSGRQQADCFNRCSYVSGINGYVLDAPKPDAVLIIEDLAAGRLTEEDLSRWFGDYFFRIPEVLNNN